MTAMTEERCLFENEEWLVLEGGLEHKSTGYFIARDGIANRRDDGLWSWPLHMAEKSWCAMMPFAEAFACAASVYQVETGADLARTLRIARCEVSPWPQVDRHVANPAPVLSRTLRLEDRDPILWEPGSAEKSLNGQGSRRPDDRPVRDAMAARFFALAQTPSSPRSMPRHKPRRIRRTGSRLVRMIQAAWNIR